MLNQSSMCRVSLARMSNESRVTLRETSRKLFCISDAMSRAHQALMEVNANLLANARMGVHAIQFMENATAQEDGR